MGQSLYLPSPIAFSLGPVPVRWYGLLLALGVVLGYLLIRPAIKASGRTQAQLEQLLLWLLVGGLIGARLVDVFVFEWGYFREHLGEVWQVWRGGLAWHGGLIGASAAAWVWGKKHGASLIELGDLVVPGLALGQAVGRFGNYFNQELYGLPTSLPWGIPIAEGLRPTAFVGFTHFHPTFLYESLGLVVIAYLLWQWQKQKPSSGKLFGSYLIATGVLRFALEFLRIDEQLVVYGARVGFLMAVLVALVGLGVWWRSSHRPRLT
jgi:phosphatidylglycerol:prolipoprotein diacylglycerol transferase